MTKNQPWPDRENLNSDLRIPTWANHIWQGFAIVMAFLISSAVVILLLVLLARLIVNVASA